MSSNQEDQSSKEDPKNRKTSSVSRFLGKFFGNENKNSPVQTRNVEAPPDSPKQQNLSNSKYTYNCSLLNTVWRPGTLELTESQIIFTSKVNETISIAFRDVKSIKIEESKRIRVLDIIKIETKNGEFTFSNFYKSNKTYEMLEHLWQSVLRKRLVSAQSTVDIIESDSGVLRESIDSNDSSNIDLHTEIKAKEFHVLFRLPKEEKLVESFNSSLWKSNSEIPGKLYLSENFISFCAPNQLILTIPYIRMHKIAFDGFAIRIGLDLKPNGKRRALLFSLKNSDVAEATKIVEQNLNELQLISILSLPNNSPDSASNPEKKLTKSSSTNGELYSGKFSMTDSRTDLLHVSAEIPVSYEKKEGRNIETNLNSSEGALAIEKLQLDNLTKSDSQPNSPSTSPRESKSPGVAKAMLLDREQFSEEYTISQTEQIRNWDKYFSIYGNPDATLIKDARIKRLIVSGIPDKFRGKLWYVCSGAVYKAILNKGYYKKLLESHANEKSLVAENIEMDLPRTLPEHEFFKTEQGRGSLRNVLTAFSWHNKEIGYAQAMNFICSILLIFMGEEDAFWTLTTICEDLVKDYYHKSLVGTIVDEKVFEYLVAEFFPNICSHLAKLDVPLSLFSQSWFLCLFINYVPFETSFSILDWFFYEGTASLFCVALSILQEKEEAILKANSLSIFTLMKEKIPISSSKRVMEAAHIFFSKLPLKKMKELENANRHEAIQTIEKATKKRTIASLGEKTKFNSQELDFLYEAFQSTLMEPIHVIEFDHFQSPIFTKYIPEWKGIPGLDTLVFNAFDVNNTGALDVRDFVLGMEKIRKDSLEDQFKFCWKLLCKENSIDKANFQKVVDIFVRLHTLPKEEQARLQKLEEFSKLAFSSLNKTFEENLALDEIKKEILQKHLIDFFNVGEKPNMVNQSLLKDLVPEFSGT